MITAVNTANPDKVKQALAEQPNINALSKNGKTALHYALDVPPVNRATIVKMLIDAGADPNLNGSGAVPALSMAAMKNDIPIMNMLIAAGADVAKGDWDDAPPFIYAAANNAREALDLLLGKGQSVNRTDKNGLYPVDHALITGQSEMAKYLRTLGGKSALDQVKTKEDAQRLMQQAKVEATQNFLELQVFYNNIFCTRLMLKAGFPVNTVMNQTLPDLAKNGRVDMMEALLEAGANPNIVVDGKTAMDEARKRGDQAAIQLISKYANKQHHPKSSSPLTAVEQQTVPVTQDPMLSATQQQSVQQQILIEVGESIPSGATGNYGQQTVAAMKSFQRKKITFLRTGYTVPHPRRFSRKCSSNNVTRQE